MNVPLCPTFFPTPEEFRNPLVYINSIRSKAEPYGICKIVPPKEEWRPTFALQPERCSFHTKVQRIDLLMQRVKNVKAQSFENDVRRFLKAIGRPLSNQPTINGIPVDFAQLYGAVKDLGGFYAVQRKRKWHEVAQSLEYERVSYAPNSLRNCYEKYLFDYEQADRAGTIKDIIEEAEASATGISGYNGGDPTKYEELACELCRGAGFDDKVLICDECDRGFHMFCLSPPLTAIPEGSWFCPECAAERDEAFGYDDGRQFTLRTYKLHADKFRREWYGEEESTVSIQQEERDFWSIVETGKPELEVEYGSDVDVSAVGSGFPRTGPIGKSGWNLMNMPTRPESIVGYLSNISGFSIPWLYCGMLFTAFCWHAEDHYCYSINYNHIGAPKHWYGIPGTSADAFETAMRETLPELFASQPDLLFQLVTMLSPSLLMRRGVPVYQAVQNAGEFVITFPQAYHAGFNHGFNVAEAVNFALPNWVPYGLCGLERYRHFHKVPIFCYEELLCQMAIKIDDRENAVWLREVLIAMRDEQYLQRARLHRLGGGRGVSCDTHNQLTAPLPQHEEVDTPAHSSTAAGVSTKREAVDDDDEPMTDPSEPSEPSAPRGAGRMMASSAAAQASSAIGMRMRKSTEINTRVSKLLAGAPPSPANSVPSPKNRNSANWCRMNESAKDSSQLECLVCRHALYVSVVMCDCSPDRVACLRHAEHLCECPPSKRYFLYRHSLAELDEMVAVIDAMARADMQRIPADRRERYKNNMSDAEAKSISESNARLLMRGDACFLGHGVKSYVEESRASMGLAPNRFSTELALPSDLAEWRTAWHHAATEWHTQASERVFPPAPKPVKAKGRGSKKAVAPAPSPLTVPEAEALLAQSQQFLWGDAFMESMRPIVARLNRICQLAHQLRAVAEYFGKTPSAPAAPSSSSSTPPPTSSAPDRLSIESAESLLLGIQELAESVVWEGPPPPAADDTKHSSSSSSKAPAAEPSSSSSALPAALPPLPTGTIERLKLTVSTARALQSVVQEICADPAAARSRLPSVAALEDLVAKMKSCPLALRGEAQVAGLLESSQHWIQACDKLLSNDGDAGSVEEATELLSQATKPDSPLAVSAGSRLQRLSALVKAAEKEFGLFLSAVKGGKDGKLHWPLLRQHAQAVRAAVEAQSTKRRGRRLTCEAASRALTIVDKVEQWLSSYRNMMSKQWLPRADDEANFIRQAHKVLKIVEAYNVSGLPEQDALTLRIRLRRWGMDAKQALEGSASLPLEQWQQLYSDAQALGLHLPLDSESSSSPFSSLSFAQDADAPKRSENRVSLNEHQISPTLTVPALHSLFARVTSTLKTALGWEAHAKSFLGSVSLSHSAKAEVDTQSLQKARELVKLAGTLRVVCPSLASLKQFSAPLEQWLIKAQPLIDLADSVLPLIGAAPASAGTSPPAQTKRTFSMADSTSSSASSSSSSAPALSSSSSSSSGGPSELPLFAQVLLDLTSTNTRFGSLPRFNPSAFITTADMLIAINETENTLRTDTPFTALGCFSLEHLSYLAQILRFGVPCAEPRHVCARPTSPICPDTGTDPLPLPTLSELRTLIREGSHNSHVPPGWVDKLSRLAAVVEELIANTRSFLHSQPELWTALFERIDRFVAMLVEWLVRHTGSRSAAASHAPAITFRSADCQLIGGMAARLMLFCQLRVEYAPLRRVLAVVYQIASLRSRELVPSEYFACLHALSTDLFQQLFHRESEDPDPAQVAVQRRLQSHLYQLQAHFKGLVNALSSLAATTRIRLSKVPLDVADAVPVLDDARRLRCTFEEARALHDKVMLAKSLTESLKKLLDADHPDLEGLEQVYRTAALNNIAAAGSDEFRDLWKRARKNVQSLDRLFSPRPPHLALMQLMKNISRYSGVALPRAPPPQATAAPMPNMYWQANPYAYPFGSVMPQPYPYYVPGAPSPYPPHSALPAQSPSTAAPSSSSPAPPFPRAAPSHSQSSPPPLEPDPLASSPPAASTVAGVTASSSSSTSSSSSPPPSSSSTPAPGPAPSPPPGALAHSQSEGSTVSGISDVDMTPAAPVGAAPSVSAPTSSTPAPSSPAPSADGGRVTDLTDESAKEKEKASKRAKDKSDEVLYCVCFRPRGNLQMVTCADCKVTYHAECMLVPEPKPEPFRYSCPLCCVKRGTSYPYGCPLLEVHHAQLQDVHALLGKYYSQLSVKIREFELLALAANAFYEWEQAVNQQFLALHPAEIIRRGWVAHLKALFDRGASFCLASTIYFEIERLVWRCSARELLHLIDSYGYRPPVTAEHPPFIWFESVKALYARSKQVEYLLPPRRLVEEGHSNPAEVRMKFAELSAVQLLVHEGIEIESQAERALFNPYPRARYQQILQRAERFNTYLVHSGSPTFTGPPDYTALAPAGPPLSIAVEALQHLAKAVSKPCVCNQPYEDAKEGEDLAYIVCSQCRLLFHPRCMGKPEFDPAVDMLSRCTVCSTSGSAQFALLPARLPTGAGAGAKGYSKPGPAPKLAQSIRETSPAH